MTTNKLQEIKTRYGIIGNSEALNRALDIAVQVAPTNLSVLIEGESGVGKDVLSRIIHDYSRRKNKRYLPINCGGIPEGTIESELFGHEKGAFTGALGEKEGYFGTANGGTLFLDEIGELPLSTQVKLLRVLESGEYIRVGANEVKKTDVRIVAATNVKLQQAITKGEFREDLYYRLSTITISMPPLRDRGDDVELLFKKFAYDVADSQNSRPITLTDDAAKLIRSYKWPGNIRQLRNIVERLSLLCSSRMVTPEGLRMAGVTNDNEAGTSLVVTNPKTDTYENERSVLFLAIQKLGMEISEIKAMINNQQSPVKGPHIYEDQTLQEILPAEEFTLLEEKTKKGKKKK